MKWLTDTKIFYLYAALNKRFALPIIYIFMIDQGLTISQISLITAVSFIVGIVLELPSGAIADTLGHKRSLMLSSIGQMLAMACYLGGTFEWIFAGAFLYWTAGTLMTGTRDALLYERLVELGQGGEYQTYYGRSVSFSHGVGIVAMVLAGILYAINPLLPFYVGVAQFAMSVLVISKFQEAKKSVSVQKREGFSKLFMHFGVAVRDIFKRRELVWVTVLNGLVIGIFFAVTDFQQIVLEQLGFAVALIGFFYAAKRILAVLLSPFAKTFTKRFDPRIVFVALGALMALHLIPTAYVYAPYLLAGIFLVGTLASLIQDIVMSDYTNKRIPNGSRSTTISLQNLIRGGFQVLCIGTIGLLSDAIGLDVTFTVIGCALLIFVGFLALPVLRTSLT